MNSGIYIIKNIITGKIYIGSAVNIEKRLYAHLWALKKNRHDNIHLQRAWNKDGEAFFLFDKYLNCEIKDLIFYEQLTIDASIIRYGRENIYNINPHAGSTLGRKHSEETKRKIGLKSKGRWTGKHHTEETKKKIGLHNIGKHNWYPSLETRNKMSIARKGKSMPEEVRQKIRLKNMGHKVSIETRNKLRLANIGKKRNKIV